MTPEAALITAIVTQAVNDLSDPDTKIRQEAFDFFFSTTPGRAKIRAFYCNAIGVDPAHVQDCLHRSGKASPRQSTQPAVTKRGVNPFTVDDLRALIPTDSAFQLADLAWPETVSQQLRNMRMAVLLKEGFVEKVGLTWYALKSLAHPRMLTNKERILSVLGDRPMTTKEIAACLRPKLAQAAAFDYCEILVRDGFVDKCGPATYRLKRDDQIAA